MRPSTYNPLPMTVITPTTTTDIKTFTPPKGTSAVLISVETNDARVTLDGTDPSGGTGSLIYPKGQAPALLLIGPGCTIKAVSTAAGNSVVNIAPLQ